MTCEARVDGLGESAGVARIESGGADVLLCLATVVSFLAREIGNLTGQAQGAALTEGRSWWDT